MSTFCRHGLAEVEGNWMKYEGQPRFPIRVDQCKPRSTEVHNRLVFIPLWQQGRVRLQ